MKNFFITTPLIVCAILLLSSGIALAQQGITGKVLEEVGKKGMPGVTVVVKGENKGTITDANGKFTINQIAPDATLMFSFLGYETKEVPIKGRSNITIRLTPDAVDLENIVVVGYGTAKKSDLTGSVASIQTEDLQKTATSNFDQALAGRVAGVSVAAADGTPGQGLQITIRGGNSITGDNSPLYVVDGLPLDDFDPASISTSDIESFDVLKDASATAIYGSRGANGVIIITTKQGTGNGKTSISADLSYRLDYIQNKIQVLGAAGYTRFQEARAYALDGYRPGEEVYKFRNKWGYSSYYSDADNRDWQDEVFELAPTLNARVNMSGGNKKTKFYYSGEYLDQEGTLINTRFNKLINNLKLTHKIDDKSTLNFQLQYSYMNRAGANINGSSYSSFMKDVVRFQPTETFFDDGLNFGYDPNDPDFATTYNPVDNLMNTDRQNRSSVTRGNVGYDRKIGSKFSLSLKGVYQVDDRKETIYYGANTLQGARGPQGVNGAATYRTYTTLSTSNTFSYKNKIGKNNIAAMVGMEAQSRVSEMGKMKNTFMPIDGGIYNLGLASSSTIAELTRSENRLLSYFARLNYNYNDKYLLTATMRADGSSKFKNNLWGFFPSASAAWRFNKEEFASGMSFLSNGKLRFGWGVTGNNRIGDFESYSTMNFSSSSGAVWGTGESYKPGVYQDNLGIESLRWEKTAQVNVGLDLGLLDQKISASIDYYKKNTTDLLLDGDMAMHTGFVTVQQNVGEVQNQGIELVLNTVNLSGKLKWQTDFNIACNRNKIIALNEGRSRIVIDPDYTNVTSEYQYISEVGQPVGQIFGVQYDGLYQRSDFIYDNINETYSLKEGITDNGNAIVSPGALKYVDQNGDGTINGDDRVIIGNTQPKFEGGLTNSFQYKGLDAQIMLQFVYDFDILNGNKLQFSQTNYAYNGMDAQADSWTPYNTEATNQGTKYDQFLVPPTDNSLDSRFVEDGSYIRLQSISLGYTLPPEFSRKMNVQKVRFYFSGNNLYTWTNYSGPNPDVSVGRKGALTPRLDYSAYPASTSFLIGINLTF